MKRLPPELTGAVVVVTGPPGAGKSTATGHLVTRVERGVLLDGDSFFTAVTTGWVEPWKPAAGPQNQTVIDALGAAAARYARGGYAVFVEGIVGPWFLDRFRAEIEGPVHYVVLRPNKHAAFARASQRPATRGSSAAAVAKMYDEFASVGVYERCVVDNSMHTLAETVRTIAEGLAAGRFRV